MFNNLKIVGNNKPICSCKPNFFGNPLVGCTRECQQDSDCGYTQKCDIKYRSVLLLHFTYHYCFLLDITMMATSIKAKLKK